MLFFAVLFGFALMRLGERAHALRGLIDDTAQAMFTVIGIIMKAAPLGAFGAMAYTIGKFGPSALGNLLNLLLTFYVTSALFVLIVLGVIARIAGFSILSFLRYIKDELLIVLGTSSSESALPSLMAKLERLGCSKQVVGLVVPTGYSFNLDGTNIYMTLATLFIAQALHIDLSIGQLLTILLVAMLDLEGRQRRHRRGLRRARRHTRRGGCAAGAGPGDRIRHRQVHERGSGADQHHRQRRRRPWSFIVVGGGTGSGEDARGVRGDGRRRRHGASDPGAVRGCAISAPEYFRASEVSRS